MEELSFDNIFGEDNMDTLFTEPEEPAGDEPASEDEEASSEEKSQKKTTTEVVDPETLFEDEQPESVGSGKDSEVQGKEDAVPDKDDGTSPNNFYSSFASALAEDGIFPNLEEETVKKANTAEAISDLIDAEVNARFDERQQRILKALDNGVEPSDIKKYENTLNFISNITDKDLAEESDKGEQLRKNIIYQDFLNKGYTPEKAMKFTERAFNAGTDIEDAREALQSNKEFFQNAYNNLLQDAKAKTDAYKAEVKKQSEKLKESIMKDKQLFGDLEISNETRRKAYENISKPVYRDPETGEYYTAIQKYEMEHRGEFLKYAGLIFTLTNGFKDFDSFTKGKVKKEVRKGLRNLENVINTTQRTPDGGLKLVTGARDDPESWLNGDFKLAL